MTPASVVVTFSLAMNANLAAHARSAVAPRAPISQRNKRVALAIAALADVAQMFLFPLFFEGAVSPFEDALDVAVAIVLVFVLGFNWRLALAFALELVPGVDLFPTWTAVVASLPSEAPASKELPPGPSGA